MTTTLYHYPGCSTCRKARRWLSDNGVEHDLVDMVATPPGADRIAAVHGASGLPIKRFFNTSGQSYRGGGWKDRLPGLSTAEAHAALAADGKLIKRPILVREEPSGIQTVLVGFKPADWAAALGA